MEQNAGQVHITRLRDRITHDLDAERSKAAKEVANSNHPVYVVRELLDEQRVRRWARIDLLPILESEHAAHVSRLLLDFPEDFMPQKVDRSTMMVVDALTEADLDEHALMLAGSNAAEQFWRRLARLGEDNVFSIAERVLKSGETHVRESTLHHLVLDPYGPELLQYDRQIQLLRIALRDPDAEIRGLAAEALAAEQPEYLLELWRSAPGDESERFRLAFWKVAFAAKFDQARNQAPELALNSCVGLDVRRTALLALGEHLSTREIAPVLIALMRGEESIIAEDAAELMWRYHRAPDIAAAAAESNVQSVRELAERLLHPERGSPAAGGSRPGDPTRPGAIFDWNEIGPGN